MDERDEQFQPGDRILTKRWRGQPQIVGVVQKKSTRGWVVKMESGPTLDLKASEMTKLVRSSEPAPPVETEDDRRRLYVVELLHDLDVNPTPEQINRVLGSMWPAPADVSSSDYMRGLLHGVAITSIAAATFLVVVIWSIVEGKC